jgi:hypothetical protein
MNKWLLLLFVSLLLIFIIHNNIINIEKLENLDRTVRTLEEYVTKTKTDKFQNIVNLKSVINDKIYYLGNIDVEKIKKDCDLCKNSKNNKKVLLLCNKNLKAKKNCINEETTACYNNQTIVDCDEYVSKKCNNKKINAENFEFIINVLDPKSNTSVLIKTKEKTKNQIEEPSLDDDKMVNCVSLLEPGSNDNKDMMKVLKEIFILGMPLMKQQYAVCCDVVDKTLMSEGGAKQIEETQKIYIENGQYESDDTQSDDEQSDESIGNVPNVLPDTAKEKKNTSVENKVHFKVYFKIGEKKKYVGHNDTNECCVDDKCQKNYLSLTVYDDPTHKNILTFEPELVKIVRQ